MLEPLYINYLASKLCKVFINKGFVITLKTAESWWVKYEPGPIPEKLANKFITLWFLYESAPNIIIDPWLCPM
jgi:hypothetical protein